MSSVDGRGSEAVGDSASPEAASERPRLTRYDLEAVIRRAVAIEAREASDSGELSESDLLRIAAEVGLSEDSVRRALAEHFAGERHGLLADRARLARVCGPGVIRVSRRVPGGAADVRSSIESHLRSHEYLTAVRRVEGGSLWEPEKSVVATVMKSLDLSRRGYGLSKKVRSLEVRVTPEGERWAHVTLVADLGSERAGWFWGVGIGGGGAASGMAAIWIAGFPGLPALLLAGTPLLLAGGLAVARAGYMRAIENARRLLEGLLDRLEQGEPLALQRPSWRDLIS